MATPRDELIAMTRAANEGNASRVNDELSAMEHFLRRWGDEYASEGEPRLAMVIGALADLAVIVRVDFDTRGQSKFRAMNQSKEAPVSEGLKPCPFCGCGKTWETSTYVVCEECQANGSPRPDDPETKHDWWNRRTPSPAASEMASDVYHGLVQTGPDWTFDPTFNVGSDELIELKIPWETLRHFLAENLAAIGDASRADAARLGACPYCAEKVRFHAGKPTLTHRSGCPGLRHEMPDIEHREMT